MTTTVDSTDHLHGRPDWTCRRCRQPWPCEDAKENLLAEFSGFPSVLAIYLSTQMYDAIGDLAIRGQKAPTDLYDRFLSWAVGDDEERPAPNVATLPPHRRPPTKTPARRRAARVSRAR